MIGGAKKKKFNVYLVQEFIFSIIINERKILT